jgi:osmotically-inducible protein OsmY
MMEDICNIMAQQPILPNIEALEDEFDLYQSVVEAVDDLYMVRESGVNLDITLHDGVVTVSGVVLSPVMRQAVLYTIATVPGIRKVVDQLYDDQQIQMAVAAAIGDAQIYVRSYRGVVTLSGKAVSQEALSKAKAAAAGIAGVRDVYSEVVVPPSEEEE